MTDERIWIAHLLESSVLRKKRRGDDSLYGLPGRLQLTADSEILLMNQTFSTANYNENFSSLNHGVYVYHVTFHCKEINTFRITSWKISRKEYCMLMIHALGYHWTNKWSFIEPLSLKNISKTKVFTCLKDKSMRKIN